MRISRWAVSRAAALRVAAALGAAGVVAPAPVWAQSAELREAVRLQRPGATSRAQAELDACVEKRRAPCAEAGSLGLLVGTLLLSDGAPAEAAAVLARHAPPELLAPYHAYALGQARFYTRDYARAAEDFRRASGAPGAPETLAQRAGVRLGEALLLAGRPAEALPLLDAAVQRLGTPELLLQRAQARAAGGDAAGALADLEAVWVGAPASALAEQAEALRARLSGPGAFAPAAEARLQRARGLLEAEREEAALAELDAARKAPGLKWTAELVARRALLRGRTLYALKRDKEARAELARAMKGPPAVAAEAAYAEARRTLRTDDRAKARAQMALVDRRFPKEPEADDAAFYVGWLHLQDGQHDAAVAAFGDFEKRHPRSRRRDEVRWFAALARLEQGRPAEARALLSALVADFPRSSLVPQARYWMARSLQLTGADAAGEYAALVEAFPHTYYALLARARLAEAGQKPPAGFPEPPRARPPAEPPPGELALARALMGAGLFRDAADEVDARVRAVRTAAEALRLGHALAAMEQHGAAFALANRFLWADAFGRKDPEALSLFYPRAWAPSVEPEATRTSVEPFLVWAIMRRESAFKPDAYSSADARGLMQLIPPTASAIARELGQEPPAPADLFSPGVNVRYGAWYLARLLERFKHPALAAAAYNGGPPAVLRWVGERREKPLDLFVEQMPYKETRAYVKQVLADLHLYRSFYGGPGAVSPLSLEVPAPATSGVAF
jgi:soluble lytic murein transglycosylase